MIGRVNYDLVDWHPLACATQSLHQEHDGICLAFGETCLVLYGLCDSGKKHWEQI